MQAVFLRDTLDAAASDAEEQACFGVFFAVKLLWTNSLRSPAKILHQ